MSALTMAPLLLLPLVTTPLEAPSGLDALRSVPCVEPGRGGVHYETMSPEWSWSPGGDLIVFDRAVGDVSQLRVVDPVSGAERCLTDGEAWDVHPSWSPRGGRIAFVRGRGADARIHLLDLEDGSISRLPGQNGRAAYPAFAPDGERLAYVRYPDGDAPRRLLVVRNLATGEERVVFDSPRGLNNLAWTPAGDAVVLYSIDEDGWNDVYEAAADGSGVRRVTDNTVTDTYSMSWAPDASRYVFGQGSEVSPFHRWFNYDLYLGDAESGSVRRVTWALHADDRAHFSPDGTKIGFVSRRSGYAELYVTEADGTRLRRITSQPGQELTGAIERDGLEAGLAHHEKVRAADPDAVLLSDRAASVLTHRYLARGAPASAVRVARVGVETHPGSWWARTALARALLAAGEEEAARDAFRESLAINPNQYQVVFDLGLTVFLDVLDSIEGVYEDRGLDVLRLAEVVRDRGGLHASMALLRRLEQVHRGDPDVLDELADVQLSLGDHAGAALQYRRVLAVDPGRAWSRMQLGRIRELAEAERTEGVLEPAHPDQNHWGPAWAPDGRRLAYAADVDGDFEIFVLDLETRRTVRLTDKDAADWRPDWSPDGGTIVFTSDRDGDLDVYAMRADGSDVQRLTDNDHAENRVRFSPDGRWIAFDSDRSGTWGVYVMGADGSNPRVVFDGPGFDGYPAWAPDGRRIVLTSDAHDPDGGGAARELYTVPAEGGAPTRVTFNEATDQAPDWSPDGARIAYFSQQDGNPEIYVVAPDGSGQTRLTDDEEWDFMPRWSPDGSRIAFDSRRDGRRGIWTMDADGRGPVKWTNLELSEFVRIAREGPVEEAMRRLRVSREWDPTVPWFLPEEVAQLGRELDARGEVESGRALLALVGR